jgi:3',5'-cyclic AMP phosphodiesterase CpdA
MAHISDIHFGREDPVVAEGLVADLKGLAPDLLVNSGDFTQRARRRQFGRAAAFMARLPHPQLSVPGNHDIPLYDVFHRFFRPLSRYQKFVSRDLFPHHVDEEIAVVGLTTARSFTWKNGRISGTQIERLRNFLDALPPDLFKVVVTHHPFLPPPGGREGAVALVGRAARALEVIDEGGVDLLLAGHLHHGYSGDIRTAYPKTRRPIVVAQAGTAMSHRVRHEPNAYNHIILDRECIDIRVRVWTGDLFQECGRVVYHWADEGWRRET